MLSHNAEFWVAGFGIGGVGWLATDRIYNSSKVGGGDKVTEFTKAQNFFKEKTNQSNVELNKFEFSGARPFRSYALNMTSILE